MRIDAEVRFAVVPEWVLDAKISAQAVRLYAVLARFAGQDNRANPSRRKLADRMHCSRDTIDRALRELQEIGAVQIIPQRSEHGDPTSNLYVLMVRQPSRTNAHTPTDACIDGRGTNATTGSRILAARGSRKDAALNESHSEREPIERKPTERKQTSGGAGAPRVRPPDLLFEAVVTACYGRPDAPITDTERGRVNRALKELRKVGATPDDVRDRAAEYRARSPDYPLMPQTLTKLWTDLAISRLPARGKPRGGQPAEDYDAFIASRTGG